MDFWFTKGRPAIFKALNQVCEQIDSELLSELSAAHASEPRRSDGHQNNVSRVEESSEQSKGSPRDKNATTQAQLPDSHNVSKNDVSRDVQKIPQDRPVHSGQPSFSRPMPSTVNDPTGLEKQQTNYKLEYANLSARFNALSENFKKAKSALEKRKEERDRWIQHANHLENKIRLAENEHNIKILDRHISIKSASPSHSASFLEEPELAGNATSASLPQAAETSAQVDGAFPGSTQDEPEDELPPLLNSNSVAYVKVKQEPSSDSPVVVSERAVRKRKRDDPVGDVVTARRIKVEESDGSSPTVEKNGFKFSPQDSIDLGETSTILATPRKRRDANHCRQETYGSEITAAVATPVAIAVRPDGVPQTTRPDHFRPALTPISVNRRVVRSGGDKPAPKSPKALGRRIGSLAENGAVYETEAPNVTPTGPRSKPAIKSKLKAMLNKAPAEMEEEEVHVTPRQRRLQGTSRDELSVPARRQLPFDKSAPQAGPREKATASPVHQTTARQANPSVSKIDAGRKRENAPSLRNKPISELRLEDFKINPLVNDGEDFAFSEVVRNKDERACLPGCTDMLCCGKQFRALAISQRPNPPLTPAQQEEERKLLEDYLGDYAYRLADMSEDERLEVWVEAKTQELANKYGKHRHRFSRMQSPPGFWNADFPSTQELEADRSEASKREQAALKERYREAMRPGGRWLFRDEQPTLQ